MNKVIEEIYATQTVKDRTGKQYALSDSISIEEGEFLASLIRDNGVSRSIEVGCAYGLSSLFICEALAINDNALHLIIDPYQNSRWHGIGINYLEELGYSFVDLIEEGSEIALPRLVAAGQKFDFGFIDGFHTFDHTLIDLFYLNRLIEPGGIIAVHDIPWKSVSRAVSYVSNYPCYEIAGAVPAEKTARRNSVNRLRKAMSAVASVFPENIAGEIFNGALLGSNRDELVGSSLLALRKIKPDERSFAWYEPF